MIVTVSEEGAQPREVFRAERVPSWAVKAVRKLCSRGVPLVEERLARGQGAQLVINTDGTDALIDTTITL